MPDLGNINGLSVDVGDLKMGDALVRMTVVIEDAGFEFVPEFNFTTGV